MSIDQAKAVQIVGGFDHDMTVAVVIPTFNERDNIGNIVQQLLGVERYETRRFIC